MLDIIYTVWVRDMERLAYFVCSVQSMKENAKFYEMPVKWMVAVETQDMILRDELTKYCKKEDIAMHFKETPASMHSMMNYSNALGDSPYVLFMQDDWQLRGGVNFKHGVEHLQRNDDWWVLRYRCHNFDKAIDLGNNMLELSPKMKGYYYSDNPHIKKRGYHDLTGPFKPRKAEGFDAAGCENNMSRQAKAIGHDHKIISFGTTPFHHLGSCHTVLKPLEAK